METWKDIKGYEGIYQASDLGRIRTVEGKVTHSIRHGIRRWRSRILKFRGHNPQTGHRVALWKNKNSKDYLVARLVAFTFFGKDIRNRKLTVNHKDGNRFNNKIDNLELISLADNVKHAFKEGLVPTRKIKLYNKREEKIETFFSFSECNRFLGKNHSYISTLIKRKKTYINETYDIYKVYPYKKRKKGTF